MNKKHFLYSAIAILGLSGPLLAENMPVDRQSCLTVEKVADETEDCAALQAEFRDKVATCMNERRSNVERSHAAKHTRTSHGVRARYLLCSRAVRDGYLGSGN